LPSGTVRYIPDFVRAHSSLEVQALTFIWTLYSGTPTEPDLARQLSAVKPHGIFVTMDAVSVNPYAKHDKTS